MTTQKQPTTAVAKQKDITEKVLQKINIFIETGTIVMPNNYVPENALRSAFLILQETTDRNNKPVLESCTNTSIANSLLEMTLKGLNPYKNHGSFIAYGNKLQWQDEYAGNKVLAKRFAGVKEVTHNTIYEGDEFVYEIDKSGRKQIVKHIQDFKNIAMDKIVGAYATAVFEDGTTVSEIMNMTQIRQSWQMGATKGQSPAHKQFPDRMAEKTVCNRLCRQLTNSSDDGAIFSPEEKENKNAVVNGEEIQTKKEIKDVSFSNVEDTDFEEVQDTNKTPDTDAKKTDDGIKGKDVEKPSPTTEKEKTDASKEQKLDF